MGCGRSKLSHIGGSILGSVILGGTFRQISQLWDNAHTLNLENCLLYLSSTISIFFTLSYAWFLILFSIARQCIHSISATPTSSPGVPLVMRWKYRDPNDIPVLNGCLRWLKTVSSTFQDVDFDVSLLPLVITWCYNHGIKKLPKHWWTRWYHFRDTIGYYSNIMTCSKRH